jgi:16S rRNA (guanine(966)-N(2))-methyltransferase RsmD
MRIVAGKFRGRKLKGPEGMDLRPTSDRLKQTLFNIIGPRVIGAAVADVFAGSGAIGLEALSRGAREAVFIDSDRAAVRLIRRNLALCGVTSGCRILHGDVFAQLRMLGREGFKAEIIFFDPPYEWGPYGDLVEVPFKSGVACEESLVIVEHHRKAVLPDSGPGFRRTRTVEQSDKRLSFYEAAREE